MPQITIKDIARELAISPSTVSRALRNHPDISLSTKARVQDLAAQYDYHPNSIAKSLQNRKSNNIGIIVPEIKHHFFSSAISGIEEVAYQAGYTIMVCQTNETYQREVMNTQALISNRVAGLLVSISQTTHNLDHLRSVIRRGVPLVFFDRITDDIEASKVFVDDHHGAMTAVEHLIQAGYRRIAHIAGPDHISIGKKRLQGYRDALKKHNRPLDQALIVRGGFRQKDGTTGTAQLLKLDPPPDAIFAVNDPVAIGALVHLKKCGLKIPKDMALVGFSNNPISELIEPALTTVDQPAYEIGKSAANLLLEQVAWDGEGFKPQIKTFPTRLIVRGST